MSFIASLNKSWNFHFTIMPVLIDNFLSIQTNEKMLLSGAEVDTMSDVELQHVADKSN